ncbi:tautomerase family protein [Diaphorobacter aerolatus]|uniref:4-oxalocrotonate tautomerase n=1 Tax=Diaphorobacter aerolatus TaxID=1288495 RepID=A0A7H0GG75_9BURK|nr:4-oxalocrotonate tautomerase [Diaphorobacter aerolatus]QNP47291.1 4-oxalocrotonate tautomerase [Diaphorobacter aerolatus]
MPHILLHHSGPVDAALARSSVDKVMDLTCRVLGKKPEVISIQVLFTPEDQWFIGASTLAESGRSAFHLDISVTDETNTKAEKAQFIRELFDAMKSLRPNLHDVSYVYVIDARAAAYGYGGKTQEYRHQQAGV